MSAISGVVATYVPLDPREGLRMLDRLTHRGPDGGATQQLDAAWLGHRRLVIIDIAGGAQPPGHAWTPAAGFEPGRTLPATRSQTVVELFAGYHHREIETYEELHDVLLATIEALHVFHRGLTGIDPGGLAGRFAEA